MNWNFITSPDEVCRTVVISDERQLVMKRGTETGVVFEPMKILVPTGDPVATKWFESIGIEVVEVKALASSDLGTAAPSTAR